MILYTSLLFEPMIARRGRGLGRLIGWLFAGLASGNPAAWGITFALVLGLVGFGVYKVKSAE